VSDELTSKERDLAQRLAENPMDMFQGKSLAWLEDFIRITVGGGGGGAGGGNTAVLPVGFSAVIQKDLTAENAEYVYTDSDGGEWLYCNGVAVSQTTYADLYAFYGANAFGTDSGGNFFLPDARGRAMFLTGTHTNADLGDNDGVAVASRQAKHAHTNGATITGTPGGTFASSTHTHDSGTYKVPTNDTADSGVARAAFTTSGDQDVTGSSGTPSATSSPTAGDLAVGGTIGTGTTGDAPAHLFIGSLLVRF
jgi:microcystin-dependent protein